jgi:hypothetical protein
LINEQRKSVAPTARKLPVRIVKIFSILPAMGGISTAQAEMAGPGQL